MELIVSEERDIDSVDLGQWLREALGPLRGVRSFRSTPRPVPAAPGRRAAPGPRPRSAAPGSQRTQTALAQIDGVRDIRDSFNSGGRELNIKRHARGRGAGAG
jgi:hypothetical protein